MPGEIDVYRNCPCGSGKKLKFCCLPIIGEMLKILEMQEHHQFQMALTALESLEKKGIREAWSRAWIKTTKAVILTAQQNFDAARIQIREVLDELPEHPVAAALNAILALETEGYPSSKRAMYAAFRVVNDTARHLVSELARQAGAVLASQGHLLAAREHLALAVALNADNEYASGDFIDFERETEIAYPLRSHYPLAPFAGDGTHRPQYVQAAELAARGCYSDAAKAFGGIARMAPNLGWVWWNIALCHAWAAEEPLAIEAFKAAAANQTDPESSAQCLLLARLLQPRGAAPVERKGREFRVASVGKLLTRLDQQPLYARLPIELNEEFDDVAHPTACYHILDRDPQGTPSAELTLENVPHIMGNLLVFDADPEHEKPARARMEEFRAGALAALQEQFLALSEGEAEPIGEPFTASLLRSEVAALIDPRHIPADVPPLRREELQRQRWTRIIEEVWPTVPQEMLGGKSPAEAMGVPELETALRAAVLALDVFCEQAAYTLDQAAVRRRLGLSEPAPLILGPDDNHVQYSILDLHRVPFERLTDEQLTAVANRVMRLGHSALGERALRTIISRPHLVEKSEFARLYLSLANFCRRRLNTADALEWIVKGKAEAKKRKAPLESQLVWELEELLLRARDPHDQQVAQIASTLWNYYRPKIPNAAEIITAALNQIDLPGPWNSAVEVGGEGEMPSGAGVAADEIWTPEADVPQPASKLWLPGQ